MTTRAPVAERFSGGVRFLEAGAGPSVLCLHGIGSSAESFAEQLGAWPGRRVLAWDAPGYGRSEDPAGPPGTDGYADAACLLLDDAGVDRATVVGVSWGGVIALRMALRHPARVDALVLADTTVGSGRHPDSTIAMRGRGDELARLGADALARARAPRLVSDDAPAALVGQIVATMAAAVRLPGYRWAAEAMADTDHTSRLPDVAAPTLVLVGEHDRVAPVAESRRLLDGLPHADVHVLPGAGHLANQEAPDAFNRAVLRFLDSLPTSRQEIAR